MALGFLNSLNPDPMIRAGAFFAVRAPPTPTRPPQNTTAIGTRNIHSRTAFHVWSSPFGTSLRRSPRLSSLSVTIQDPWNVLDTAIVTIAWLPFFFPSLRHYNGIRAVRALRPLRTVTHLPGLRKQIKTIVDALPRLGNVFLLIGFIIAIYGILGVQLFPVALHFRCFASVRRSTTGRYVRVVRWSGTMEWGVGFARVT